jgi:hypothetical protein
MQYSLMTSDLRRRIAPGQLSVGRREAPDIPLQGPFAGLLVDAPLDYCGTPALCRFFKQQVGMTPQAYRKKHGSK